jgi:hypothetical protein
MTQEQEIGASHKRHRELIAWFAKSKSEDAIKRILQELGTLRKQSHRPPPRKQFPLSNRRETRAGGAIWQLGTKLGKANKGILEESLQRRNSAALVLIWEFQDLPSVRSMRNVRDVVVFFGSVSKAADPKAEKSYGYLTDGRLQARKADFTRCSGNFLHRVDPRHQKICWRLPFLANTFLHLTMRIGLVLISQGTVKEASRFFFASSG